MSTKPFASIVGGDQEFLRRLHRPPDPTGSTKARVVDLFAGCGGLTLGVLEACRFMGWTMDVRLAVEANPRIAEVYRSNFAPANWDGASYIENHFDRAVRSEPSNLELETKNKVGGVDLLVGGPPCQGHSPLNNHTRGFDSKNKLYCKMVRAAKILDPTHVIVENVPTVLRDLNGVVDTAIRDFKWLGYRIHHGVISMLEVGVPQRRKRHVLIASKGFEPNLEDAMSPSRLSGPRTVEWAIRDLLERENSSPLDTASVLNATNISRAKWLYKNNRQDLPNRLRPVCHQQEHRYKSMYGRLDWNEPAQTITTGFGSPGQGRYLHPERIRTITPHEAARLQFFPDWFDFSKATTRSSLAEAIGNAVPPKLGFVLAVYMLRAQSGSPLQTRQGNLFPDAI